MRDGGRGGEQVWKGEPEGVWRGAVTRFIQAIVWPQADSTRRKIWDVNIVTTWLPSFTWPLPFSLLIPQSRTQHVQ